MATYKGINGFAVQSVASDPSPLDEGQVWYNNATYAFKLASVTTAGTWAAGGNMGTARYGILAGTGTQTAALGCGWICTTWIRHITEEYNGTSWSPGGSMNTRRYLGKSRNSNSSVNFGGVPGNVTATEEYNGTSWTALPGTMKQVDLSGCRNYKQQR
jgi:hypothetical protein